MAVNAEALARLKDAMETGAVEGYCKAWGYVDLSIAN